MMDMGFIDTEIVTDTHGNHRYRPVGAECVAYAWKADNGVWGGWYGTKHEAISNAIPGSTVIEKRIVQKCIGTTRGG